VASCLAREASSLARNGEQNIAPGPPFLSLLAVASDSAREASDGSTVIGQILEILNFSSNLLILTTKQPLITIL
jgi:hypothetical protein